MLRRARRSSKTLYTMRASIFSLFFCCVLAGCDIIYGVGRGTNTFSPIPSDECVVQAVESIAGMSSVSFRLESGGRPLTLHGIEKPEVVHRFFYEYKGIRNNFYFLVNHDGSAEFHHGYLGMNYKPSQSDIDTIYPAILSVEDALQHHCGVIGLKSGIKETCSGVRCGGV
jgi:hypothetical protein